MAKGDTCEVCGGRKRVPASDIASPLPTREKPILPSNPRWITCPACNGTGKQQ